MNTKYGLKKQSLIYLNAMKNLIRRLQKSLNILLIIYTWKQLIGHNAKIRLLII
jgi:hypothetical protein